MRVLVVEDDDTTARILVKGLEAERFAVDLVRDGETSIEYILQVDYDVILLDLGLPGLDGLSVLRGLRKRQLRVPVMILSGRDAVETRVAALDAGADDYVVKPFAFTEVVARVHALLRRLPSLQDKLTVADLEVDRARRVVTRSGKLIQLTQKEYALLEYLVRNEGRPVSRTMILERVWNKGFEGLTNVVDVYINYLRAKVDNGFERKLIHTERGVGYMLAAGSDSCEEEVA